MTAENDTSSSGGEPLTNRDIARLLGGEISESDRAELVERLDTDPEAAEILGLAASVKEGRTSLDDSARIDALMKLVKADFASVVEKPVPVGKVIGPCMKCGFDVIDGSYYCPNCGAEFKEFRKAGWSKYRFLFLDYRELTLILGLSLIIAAFLAGVFFETLFGFGCAFVGLWLGYVITPRHVSSVKREIPVEKDDEIEKEKKDSGIGSG